MHRRDSRHDPHPADTRPLTGGGRRSEQARRHATRPARRASGRHSPAAQDSERTACALRGGPLLFYAHGLQDAAIDSHRLRLAALNHHAIETDDQKPTWLGLTSRRRLRGPLTAVYGCRRVVIAAIPVPAALLRRVDRARRLEAYAAHARSTRISVADEIT